jgi:steroid 5-alpha reductase family enzyme
MAGSVVIYLFLQMCLMWGLYRLLKNPSVVDVSWSMGLMISGLLYLSQQPLNARHIVIGTLLIAWALRLAIYLGITRIAKGHQDKRYTRLSDAWTISPALGFFLNFQLQGLLIFLMSSVFFIIAYSPIAELSFMDWLACGVVVIGIVGESIADIQLQHFKKKHAHAVCNVGLWNYSRHPNYFFDWLTWCGFALFGLQSSFGYLGLLSPLVLYVIFTRITGPMTEQGSVQSKGQQYIAYQQQTSMFFLWFKP